MTLTELKLNTPSPSHTTAPQQLSAYLLLFAGKDNSTLKSIFNRIAGIRIIGEYS